MALPLPLPHFRYVVHLGCSVDKNFKTLIESNSEITQNVRILDPEKSMKSGRMKIWASREVHFGCNVLFRSFRSLTEGTFIQKFGQNLGSGGSWRKLNPKFGQKWRDSGKICLVRNSLVQSFKYPASSPTIGGPCTACNITTLQVYLLSDRSKEWRRMIGHIGQDQGRPGFQGDSGFVVVCALRALDSLPNQRSTRTMTNIKTLTAQRGCQCNVSNTLRTTKR